MEDGVRNFAGFGLRTLDCGLKTQPRLQIQMKALLRFEVVGDGDNRAFGKNLPEQSRNERLGRLADTGTSQHSALLHAPGQGLHRGSWQDVSEQIACRRRCRVLRQAKERLQPKVEPSSRRRRQNHGGRAAEFRAETGRVEFSHPRTRKTIGEAGRS